MDLFRDLRFLADRLEFLDRQNVVGRRRLVAPGRLDRPHLACDLCFPLVPKGMKRPDRRCAPLLDSSLSVQPFFDEVWLRIPEIDVDQRWVWYRVGNLFGTITHAISTNRPIHSEHAATRVEEPGLRRPI